MHARNGLIGVLGIGLAGLSGPAFAGGAIPPPVVNAGDTAWLLTSAALVLLMTPGLAFFYGGLVRRKNVLSVLMQCLAAMCLVSLQWVLFGYSLSFGPTRSGWIGSLAWAGLNGVGGDPSLVYAATVPHQAFMAFQMMFAIITPALIIGAFAERMKFTGFCAFIVLWSTFCYDPVAHWVWGEGGWLKSMGALDFAGGTVVHINAGAAALAAALVLGPRVGHPGSISPPHSLPLGVLGAGLLWFGWFGFNAGSALGSGSLAAEAFVTTHVAAAAAGTAWLGLDWVVNAHPTMLGVITGAVAGLVAVTPAAGYVTPGGAIWIGIGASVISYFAVAVVKARLGYDDALDAFGVHGVGGMWGALATGIWASKAVNPGGADGLIHGNPGLLLIQGKAVLATFAWSFTVSWILLKLVDLTVGLRASDEEQRIGLDLTQHREAGYTAID